jgi:hypothetical protein
MGRRGSFSLSCAASLAAQLAFVPAETAKRQMLAVRTLLPQLAPAALIEWRVVVERITGFQVEGEESALQVVGMALRRDLCELALRLSARAPESYGTAMNLRQFARESGASVRTIDRWRRLGLPACWMRRTSAAGSTTEIAFRRADWEAFRAGVLGGAKVPKARVRRSKDERVDAGSLQRPRRQRRGRNTRRVLTAARLGVGAAWLARDLGCSRLAADRLLLGERAALLRRLAPQWLPPKSAIPSTFRRSDAAIVILGGGSVQLGMLPAAHLRLMSHWCRMLREARAADEQRQTAAEESARMMAVRFLLWRAGEGVRQLDERRPSAAALDRIETDLRWARLLLRTLLAEAIPDLAKRLKPTLGPQLNNDAIAAGVLAWSAKSLEAVVLQSDVQKIADGRVRVGAATALAMERRLAAADAIGTRAGALLGADSPLREPVDHALVWAEIGASTAQVAAALLRRTASDDERAQRCCECWLARAGWDGTMPRTMQEIAEHRRVKPEQIARWCSELGQRLENWKRRRAPA